MLDSIFIGMSGLMGYSRGLRVIANNTANINTPGFKGASLQFGDVFSNGLGSESMSNRDSAGIGQGVTTYSTSLDFSQGELRQSGNDLDLAIDGQGLFTLRDKLGNTLYTRDGEFKFNDEGFLVTKSGDANVVARDADGKLVDISLAGLRTSLPKATANITFRGNLASDSGGTSTHTLTDVVAIDAVGTEHKLTVQFELLPPSGNVFQWKVTVKDGASSLGEGTLMFIGTEIDAARSKITIDHPFGATSTPLVLDFSSDVRFVDSGGNKTLTNSGQDGYRAGDLTQVTFDADGVMNLKYANGQTAKGARLLLGNFQSIDAIRSAGDNLFEPVDATKWDFGNAQTGAFGAIRSKVVEISNVDLSSEFSDLVIMQRGYQASSQVVSTANEMLQQLFSLKGR